MNKQWQNDNGEIVDPRAPRGGGGGGQFRSPAVLGKNPSSTGIPDPHSPAGRHFHLEPKHKLTLQLGIVQDRLGNIFGTKTYSNGRYTLVMQTNGAITVKRGDWLSKYSAAMYDDFTRVHEFGRIDKLGKLKPIRNVNRIVEGEKIYHIPTFKVFYPMIMDEITVEGSPYSDDEKDQIIIDTLEDDYDLKGEQLEWLEKFVHYFLKPLDVAKELGEVAGWISEEVAMGTAGSIFAVVMGCLEPIAFGIAVLNANETDKKIAGMQAIGYTLTAWAFGDPIPPYPSSLKANFTGPWKPLLPRSEQAWKETSAATVRNLEAHVIKQKRSKKSYQIFWQGIGDWDRKKLVKHVMEAQAEDLPNYGTEKASFWSLDPQGYPN
jgi:hypothetical protein